MHALTAPAGYCLVVALLGAARERLSFSTPARAYLAEASLPIYVLHQLAIVGPGFFIIQSAAGPAAKFALAHARRGIRGDAVANRLVGRGRPRAPLDLARAIAYEPAAWASCTIFRTGWSGWLRS